MFSIEVVNVVHNRKAHYTFLVTSHVLEVYRAVREGIPNLFSKS